jgi:medium-chain acyl-[acyl-carrier-protein] hydrolase
MYSFDSRVRYSETDEHGRLSIESMMDYLQDCSTFQGEDLGIGIAYTKKKHTAWWVYSWNIEIRRLPMLGDRIRIETWPYNFRGVFGYRNFRIRTPEGVDLVLADSVWFYYDVKAMRPARPAPEDYLPYGHGERLDMPQMPRKMKVPEGGTECPPIQVMQHHLDTNRHVNNAQYIAMARECVPAGFELNGIWAEYRNMAVLGDTICPVAVPTGEGYIVSLRKPDGGVYVNVMLRGNKGGAVQGGTE